jgi:hypothetical protein
MPSKVRLRLTMIEYGLRPALHMIARRADRPTAITLGVDKCLRRRRLRQRAALDGRDMSHRRPAAVALRLTGERPGTAAMPSARAFANGSSRHWAGSRQVAGQEKTSFGGRDRVAWAFTFAATARTLVRLSKLIAETGRWPRRPASPRTLSAAGASSRWRSQRLPRSCRRAAPHLPGQVR